MREILFRGKRKSSREWMFGDLIKSNHEYHISRKLSYNPYRTDGFKDVETVIWDTVGQYTGLSDKYGKRIFEGDILDCGDRIVYVEWHQNCGTWDSTFIKYKGERCSNGITPVEWKYRATVIGNIHDNPEFAEVAR